jgi:amidase
MPDDLLRRSASEQAALVRAGDVRARELVEAALGAIERLNPSLNAFVTVCGERALAEADSVGAGDPRSLCGVPVGIKDLLSATEGIATTEGSLGFPDWVPAHDSAHVRRLRQAGAIVVGKTNTPELGLRPVTENRRFGATRNPWNTQLSAGGSSGGSASAVASGMVALADGSDLGGSIRIPASCCGLVGLKPSLGRVSMAPDYGDVAAGMPADCVLTRTVMDTAVALDAIAGYEPGDRHRAWTPQQSFAELATADPGQLRVQVCVSAPHGIPVDPEPTAAARAAGELLASLGHDVEEVELGWEDGTFPSAWGTFMAGTGQHLIRIVERLHGGRVDPGQLEPATRAWLVDSPPVPLLDYLEAGEQLFQFSRQVTDQWPDNVVLVTPTLTRLPAPVGGIRSAAGVTDDASRFSAFVRIWNVTGQPAISLPLARTDDGLPVGVQLVAAPDRDDVLISLAAQLEAATRWPTLAPAENRQES